MRLAALIVAFVLVTIGCLLLVFRGFLALTFDLGDLLVYLIIAGLVLLIVRFAGRSLDRQFLRTLDEFVRHSQDVLAGNRQMLRAYGVVLITLIPLLVYLEALALYAALAIANGIVVASGFMPISLYTLMFAVIAVLFAAIAVLSGLVELVFPSRSDAVRVRLAGTEHRQLWAAIRETAERLGVRPINQIELTPDPGIAATQAGNLVFRLFGIGRRKLIVGLPSVYGMGVGEFEAILAHEYGHFDNRDTQWFSLTHAMGTVLTGTLSAMPVMTWERVGYAGSIANAAALNPLYWILRFFGHLFFQTTRGYSRFCEIRADQEAIRLCGGQTFADALLKVSVNDLVWVDYVLRGFIYPELREGQMVRNLAMLIAGIHRERVSERTLANLRERALKERDVAGPYDTHPPLATRVNIARRYPSIPSSRETPVQELFDRWDEITTDLTKRYYKRLIQLDRERQADIAASIHYRRLR
jgi:Zn-dependent protease with chaperone function